LSRGPPWIEESREKRKKHKGTYQNAKPKIRFRGRADLDAVKIIVFGGTSPTLEEKKKTPRRGFRK